jgi:riboflavin biosynthesis pyrimidine reductase
MFHLGKTRRVRSLLPAAADLVDVIRAYSLETGKGDERPFVRCNMVSTFDGAIAVNGTSGSLGGAADRTVFQTLRSRSDVILVGAGTMRAERYGPARLSDELRQLRRVEGRQPVPPIAVVTLSGNLDWTSPFFTQAEQRPMVFTTSGVDAQVRRKGEEVADFVVAGEDSVEPRRILDYFNSAGYRSVLLEGGPSLNGDFARAGLLDEVCLTLSPHLLGGVGSRILGGSELASLVNVDIAHLLEEDGFLFARLAVRAAQPA